MTEKSGTFCRVNREILMHSGNASDFEFLKQPREISFNFLALFLIQKMGGFISKEWSEVMTSASPGSPEEKKEEKFYDMAEGAVARRRILNADPRSITDEVSRTPIQVDKTPNESTPKGPPPAYIDPRSPSTELPRTPIVLNPGKNPLSFDDSSLEVAQDEAPVVVRPNRGAIAADLKTIEAKLESIEVKEESYEKEEGEITHDSSIEENDENLICKKAEEQKTPPMTKRRSKSSLENDCRSPLLIENEETVFDKLLSNELARLATKNACIKSRKVLGVKNDNDNLDDSNNDSLVI